MLPILKYGSPALRTPGARIDVFNGELEEIAKNMIETMYAAPGIGLAASQVGINIQLATIDLSAGKEGDQLIVVCNPTIVGSSGEQKNEEGCLSIPDFTDTVARPENMVVHGQNIHGEDVCYQAEGLLARCFSHEIDHLNGVLFIDRLSALKRGLIKSKIKKLIKAGEW